MRASIWSLALIFLALPLTTQAQVRVSGREFQITKITKNLIAMPNYGIGEYRFAALPPIPGFVLNKNETPFAPLYWDRYPQIKTTR
jgi:hypothetical protein